MGEFGDDTVLVLRIQSFVVGLRVACMIGMLLWLIVAVVRLKVAVHPWSQSWPMERRLPDARVGNR